MGVVVDEARHDERTIQVDHGRRRPPVARDVAIVAHCQDPAVTDGHGLGPRLVRLDRVDRAAHEDQVGRGSGTASRRRLQCDHQRRHGDCHQQKGVTHGSLPEKGCRRV